MNPPDFARLMESTFSTIHALSAVKGGEYAPGDDRLSNFKEASRRLGGIPEQVLLVYLDKHYASLCNFVKDLAAHKDRPRSEAIDGRVDDMIVYLLLFKALLSERRETASVLSDSSPLVWEDEE